jgi:uncharacterized protein (TIGR02246 family)
VPERPGPEEAARSLLDAQVAAWNRGDLDAFCAAYADDATYVGAGAIRVGRAALLADYRARYPDGAARGHLSLEVVSIAADADRAVVVARWSLAATPPRGGAALLVLARRAGGWQVTHDATT